MEFINVSVTYKKVTKDLIDMINTTLDNLPIVASSIERGEIEVSAQLHDERFKSISLKPLNHDISYLGLNNISRDYIVGAFSSDIPFIEIDSKDKLPTSIFLYLRKQPDNESASVLEK